MRVSELYEGWRNHLLPPEKLKRVISRISRKRMGICNECPSHSRFHNTLRWDDHCMECGCVLVAKTKCLSCYCPLGFWKAVLTDEQEEEILNEKANNS